MQMLEAISRSAISAIHITDKLFIINKAANIQQKDQKKMAAKKMEAVFVAVAMMVAQTGQVQAQANTCSTALSTLNICAPFVVPGATNNKPSQDCCNALQSIDHDCFCSTVRIASQIPSQCNLPPLSCPAANRG